ncbi:MAG: peptide-methionine (R)-S-oxide reductase MsrB, partial [Kaistella sp.]
MMKIIISMLLLMSLQMCSQIKKQPQNPQLMENATTKNNPYYSRTDRTKLTVTNAEWKKILSPDLYAIAREADTER